jgi:hypothetical protein
MLAAVRLEGAKSSNYLRLARLVRSAPPYIDSCQLISYHSSNIHELVESVVEITSAELQILQKS